MKWHIASVSWGKDSLAMLLTLIAKGYPLNELSLIHISEPTRP